MLNALKVKQHRVIEDPKYAKMLFTDARFSVLWLAARVFIGLQWIEASSHKLGSPAWMDGGTALKGFWTSAVAIPETGNPAIHYDWYRSFLQGLLDAQAYTWFAKVIAFGEMAVGIALVIGAFVGIAAFFGAMMNFNFMLAGSASINPVLFAISIGLILAWKIAGFIGADYYLLNWLGTPWGRGNRNVPQEVGRESVPAGAIGD